MDKEYKMPILVRCLACSSQPLSSRFPLVLINDAYPAQTIGYLQTHDGFKKVREDIYFCEDHYREFVLKEKPKMEAKSVMDDLLTPAVKITVEKPKEGK